MILKIRWLIAKWKSIRHWERMVEWTKKQKGNLKPDFIKWKTI
jgi:hypothetical protein